MKVDTVLGATGVKSVASLPLKKQMPMESRMTKAFELPEPYLIQEQKVNIGLEKHAVGAERAAKNSLQSSVDHESGTGSNLNTGPASYFGESNKVHHVMGTQYENGLFSSSLSELFSRKLRFTSNNAPHGHSVGAAASPYEEEEPFESLEEIEAQTIGNLLPNDDDLLSGVTDGLDYVGQSNTGEDVEDFDLFSSVGGMELGEDGFPPGHRDSELNGGNSKNDLGLSIGIVAGTHPYGEHPSRTLFVRNINSNVEDLEIQALFEQYGDIRNLFTACKHRGFVMISYYDLRAAQNAMKSLQNKPLRCRKLDIHFSIPKDNPSEKDINQGMLIVSNIDSSVSNEKLHQIFGVYGEIKEIREIPHQNHHKFIEFYDSRAAEAALHALNRSFIAGKQIKLEPSCAEAGRLCVMPPFHPETEHNEPGPYQQQSSSPSNSAMRLSGPIIQGGITSSGMDSGTVPGLHSAIRSPVSPFLRNMFHHGISSSVPNSLPSLLRVESLGNQSNLTEYSHSPGRLNIEFQGTSNFHPNSLPEYHDGLRNGSNCNSPVLAANISARPSERIGQPLELKDAAGFVSSGNGSCPPPGHHFMWSASSCPQPQGLMWPGSPTFINGVSTAHTPPQFHGFPRAPSHMMNTFLPVNNQHMGPAPSVNPSLWDRQHAFAGESPETGFHPASLRNIRIPSNSPHHLEFVSQNVCHQVNGTCMDLPIPSKNVGLHSHQQRCLMFPGRGQIFPVMSSFDSLNERARNRRNESNSNQADNKKQFELDIDRIMRGEDNRTTLMIKNIPNKYTSKMLLAAIDERHRGSYDFIYLPIDFKNKCNVGYAFINMTDPSLIIPFYQTFNGKKWEKFNSEKVASLAYARIQGKVALIAHFQNSSLMNEDKRCRPILFNTEGPNAGDQVPFPMGVNARSRPNKTRATTSDENNQDGTPILQNGEESSNGDSASGSVRDSD
ncbi:hypothetical protein NMG60_11024630 [Bertholletia excelsa]